MTLNTTNLTEWLTELSTIVLNKAGVSNYDKTHEPDEWIEQYEGENVYDVAEGAIADL